VKVKVVSNADRSPVIVKIPKKIIEVMKLKRDDSLRVYVDGEQIS